MYQACHFSVHITEPCSRLQGFDPRLERFPPDRQQRLDVRRIIAHGQCHGKLAVVALKGGCVSSASVSVLLQHIALGLKKFIFAPCASINSIEYSQPIAYTAA
jgi:hypothetical protein